MEAEINEEDIPLMVIGQRVQLGSDAFPGQPLEAALTSINARGDPVLKTYSVRLALPQDTALFIGMSVDVNIVVENREDRLLVPSTAINSDNMVFIVEDGQVRTQAIEIGLRGISSVEITSGLDEEASLVSPIPEGLADGDRIATGRL